MHFKLLFIMNLKAHIWFYVAVVKIYWKTYGLKFRDLGCKSWHKVVSNLMSLKSL